MATPYHADLDEIGRFVRALFAYAEADTYISLRAFDQFDRMAPPKFIRPVRVNGHIEDIIREAIVAAEDTAQFDDAAVFCPPIATFTRAYTAAGTALANGLTLSVELDDTDPDIARARLEGIIGPLTVMIRSGSDWTDLRTGEIKPKVHLHWRLTEPTTTTEDHDRLRQARTIASLLVGGDPTGKPVVHPLRWPGSWNLKAKPRMATIAVLNETAEINLSDALEALELAAEAIGHVRHDAMPGASGSPEAKLFDIRSAMAAIPNPDDGEDGSLHYAEWVKFGYAVYRATGGSPEGFEIFDNWSRLSDKYERRGAGETLKTWRGIASSVNGGVHSNPATAGTIFFHATAHGWVRPFPFGSTGNGHDSTAAEEVRESSEPPQPFEATPLSSLDLDHIPPRRWVYGRELIRGFVSVLASPGGTGKTAYTMAVGVSVVCGKALLHLGLTPPASHCVVHKPGSVWFYNLEDPQEELLRRIKATLQHHKIPAASVSDQIFIDSGRDRALFIAIRSREGDLIAAPVVEPLIAELKRRQIAVLIIDPFVQSHSAEENRNEEMNLVMSLWAKVANEANCAVWLIHHFRKGGVGGDAESIRGAGAIQGAARSMHTISTMTEDEALRIGIQPEDRWQYVRHDNAKQNMAPPAGNAVWYRLASVTLGNGTPDYPDGDHVQAVEAWSVPSPWEGLTWEKIEKILVKIDRGPGNGEFYAMARQSKDRWAGTVIMDTCQNSYVQAGDILKTWKETGVLEEGNYVSAGKRATLACVRVNQAKFAEMRQGFTSPRTANE